MSNCLLTLHDMLDKVLKMRADVARLKLQLKTQFSPEYLHELYSVTEDDGAQDFKRCINLVKQLEGLTVENAYFTNN